MAWVFVGSEMQQYIVLPLQNILHYILHDPHAQKDK